MYWFGSYSYIMHSEKNHKEMVPASGIVTPGLTQACAHVLNIHWHSGKNNVES